MTTTQDQRLSSLPLNMTIVVTATQELREAKEMLHSGNVIKGVKRHERAKSALYQAMQALADTGIPIRRENLQKAASEQFTSFLVAGAEFTGAVDAYRVSGSDSRAALALVKAEKKLIAELDQLERTDN